MATKPEVKFKSGGVTATVWSNTIFNEGGENGSGSFFNVVISKSYKDKNDQWQESNSLKVADIPKALLVLQKAYEYTALDKND